MTRCVHDQYRTMIIFYINDNNIVLSWIILSRRKLYSVAYSLPAVAIDEEEDNNSMAGVTQPKCITFIPILSLPIAREARRRERRRQ
jgi:hypothetical protein